MRSIGFRIAAASTVVVTLLGASIAVVWFHADGVLREKHEELITNQAVEIGRTVADQVAATRSVYTKQIVAGLKPHGVGFSQNPGDGEAPLPAVFMGHVSTELAEGKTEGEAVSFVLRSGWNINPDQGVTTEFEVNGWNNLLEQQARLQRGEQAEAGYEPYWEYGDLSNGSPVIRVITADLASAPSCVSCHNQLEKTDAVRAMRSGPVKEFQLGDLMGAVVTTVPLSQSNAIAAELDEVQSSVGGWLLGAVVVGVLLATLTGALAGRQISQRIRRVTAKVAGFVDGEVDLTERLDSGGRDEVGELCDGFNKFAERMEAMVQDVSGGAAAIDSSSTETREVAESLTAQAEAASRRSEQVACSAQQLQDNMTGLNASTAEIEANIRSIAQSVEELTTRITEISENAEQSTGIVGEATALATSSNERVSVLGDAADEIGKVIQSIEDIAEQTNLLALNATIEAARAGESGKGFAVVATEVKELAKQTADATEDIRPRIEAIQQSTRDTVAAITSISEVIGRITATAESISSAVRQQDQAARGIAESVKHTAATTGTFSGRVQESTRTSQRISEAIAEVDDVLKKSVVGAARTRERAQFVTEHAGRVRSVVNRFQSRKNDGASPE